MSSNPLHNISPRDYKKFLTNAGCVHNRTKGVHETWEHPDVNRGLTWPTGNDCVPPGIVRQHLHYLNIDKSDIKHYISGKKKYKKE